MTLFKEIHHQCIEKYLFIPNHVRRAQNDIVLQETKTKVYCIPIVNKSDFLYICWIF